MASKGTVAVRFTGDTGDLSSSVDDLGSKFGSLGKTAALGFAAVGAAAIGAGKALFDIGASFDSAFDTIRVNTGKTGPALDGLKDSFKNVVSTVPADFGDASAAIAGLNQKLGLTGVPLEELSEQILNLSHITGTDAAANIDALTGLFNNFGITVDDQPERMDQLFRAFQATGVSVTDLATQMADSGVQLRDLGFTFEESAALLGSLGKAGLAAGDVMPGLSKVIAAAAKDGKDAKTAFHDFFDSIKNAGSDTDAASIAFEVLGAKAGPRMASLIREGKLSFEDLATSIGSGGDTINKAAADTADFGEKWTLFKNKILVGLEPLATGVFNAVGEAMSNLAAWWNDNGAQIMQTVDDLKQRFMDGFEAVVAQITDSKSRIGGVLASLRETFSSVFGAIKAIVDTYIKIYTDIWNRFGATLVGKLGDALRAIQDGLTGAFTVISGIFDFIKAVLTGKWGDAWEAIKKILTGAWEFIGGVLRLGVAALATIFEGAKALLSAAWSLLWNALKTLLSDAWSGYVDILKWEIGAMVGLITGIPGALGNLAHLLYDKGLEVAKGIIDGVKAGLASLPQIIWDAINDAGSNMDDIIGGLQSGGKKALGFGGKGGGIPSKGPSGLHSITRDTIFGSLDFGTYHGSIPNVPMSNFGIGGGTTVVFDMSAIRKGDVIDPDALLAGLQRLDRRNGGIPIKVRG